MAPLGHKQDSYCLKSFSCNHRHPGPSGRMIFPCPSARGVFFKPCKNHVGTRCCFLAVFLHCQVGVERSELSCHTQDTKKTLLATSNFHVLKTFTKHLLPIFLWPRYLVGWNMCQTAERCFKKAQELERSFQTPERSDAALFWLNAEEK